MTCITFETRNTKDEGSVRRSLRRALSTGAAICDGTAPREPLGSRLARRAFRALAAPFRAHAQRRARAYADFRMIDLRTLDDVGLVRSHVGLVRSHVGLVRSHVAAVGTLGNENTAHGDVA